MATATEVQAIFDERAPTWDERANTEYRRPLADALARGEIAPGGLVLDLGSGTGIHTAALRARFDAVISIDISEEMLLRSPRSDAARLRADASALPLADRCAQAIVCVNMFVFCPEYLRVLTDDGVVVFVSTRDDATPIYLPPATLLSCFHALDTRFAARGAKIGIGRWTVVQRI